MPVNRSARTLLAAGFLIAALFVAMDYAVESTPLLGWWLPLVLVVVAVALVLSTRMGSPDESVSATAAPGIHEYDFPVLAATSPAAEQSPVGSPAAAVELNAPTLDAEPEAIAPSAEFGNLDAAGQGIPTSKVEPDLPEVSSADRLQADGVLLQPADTAENEFQTGEHVAHNLPSTGTPSVTQTTGEGMGAGHPPIAPEQKVVLDTQAAPEQPNTNTVSASTPDVVDAVMSERDSEAEAAALTTSEALTSTPASGAGPDDLTVIHGIGPKIATSLRAAGIDSFTKLAGASDADLDSAIRAGGVRLAPTLVTWREQASYLARGDRDGFESLRRKLSQGGVESGD